MVGSGIEPGTPATKSGTLPLSYPGQMAMKLTDIVSLLA